MDALAKATEEIRGKATVDVESSKVVLESAHADRVEGEMRGSGPRALSSSEPIVSVRAIVSVELKRI